jgi:hypothetical protein
MLLYHAKSADALDLFVKFCRDNKIETIFRESTPYTGYGPGTSHTTWHAATEEKAFFLTISHQPGQPLTTLDAVNQEMKELGIRTVKGKIVVVRGQVIYSPP